MGMYKQDSCKDLLGASHLTLPQPHNSCFLLSFWFSTHQPSSFYLPTSSPQFSLLPSPLQPLPRYCKYGPVVHGQLLSLAVWQEIPFSHILLFLFPPPDNPHLLTSSCFVFSFPSTHQLATGLLSNPPSLQYWWYLFTSFTPLFSPIRSKSSLFHSSLLHFILISKLG